MQEHLLLPLPSLLNLHFYVLILTSRPYDCLTYNVPISLIYILLHYLLLISNCPLLHLFASTISLFCKIYYLTFLKTEIPELLISADDIFADLLLISILISLPYFVKSCF